MELQNNSYPLVVSSKLEEGQFPFYSFEEIDQKWWQDWAVEHRNLPVYVGVAYVIGIFVLQSYMSTRPSFHLKWQLFLWNTALGIFSIVGFVRTVPELYYILSQPNGYYNSICVKGDQNTPAFRYWMFLSAVSKFIELGDTLFIILRKRPLVFLQWYHHALTLSCVWMIAPLGEPVTLWALVSNLGIHALMYPYFALKALNIHVPTPIASTITTLQFAQMVMGVVTNVHSIYHSKTGSGCVRYPLSVAIGGVTYGSFFLLFGKLLYDSVIVGKNKKKKLE